MLTQPTTSEKLKKLPGDPSNVDRGMTSIIEMHDCLYMDCEKPAVHGTEWGFRLCRTHLSAARLIVPVPADFKPDPAVTPFKRGHPMVETREFYRTPERKALRTIIKANPMISDKSISRVWKYSQSMVGRVRRHMEQHGEIPHTSAKARANIEDLAIGVYAPEQETA